VQAILQGRRDVGLVHWGIFWTLNDAEIAAVANDLHAWAGDRACWVVDVPLSDANPEHPAMVELVNMYNQMGAPMYLRSLDTCRRLLQPWSPDTRGFFSFRDWHELGRDALSDTDWQALGESAGGYAAYLER
jgi:hypothetical protein